MLDGARPRTRRRAFTSALESSFFWFGTLSAVYLVGDLGVAAAQRGWSGLWFVVPAFVVVAYLLLPRIHEGLSAIYLPDYFIGRTRTRAGLLGDPVNIAVLGTESQVHATMSAAGWTLADDLGVRSRLRMIIATLTRTSYAAAPVSNLYLFGRRQPFCYEQEVGGDPRQRHHVRFWKTPDGWLLPGGLRADWLAAGTYDDGIGLSAYTLQMTHRVAETTDDERDHVIATITRARSRTPVRWIENFSTGYHSTNGGGDAISTEGDLPVIDLHTVREDPADLEAPPVTPMKSSMPRPLEVGVASAAMLLGAGTMILTLAPTPLTTLEYSVPVFTSDVLTVFTSDVLTVVPPALVGTAVVKVVLAVLAFRGVNAARLTAMCFSCISIVVGVALDLSTPMIETGLLSLALVACVVLALYARETRLWVHGSRRPRRLTDPTKSSRPDRSPQEPANRGRATSRQQPGPRR